MVQYVEEDLKINRKEGSGMAVVVFERYWKTRAELPKDVGESRQPVRVGTKRESLVKKLSLKGTDERGEEGAFRSLFVAPVVAKVRPMFILKS